jgi:hypothetical protein
LLSSPAADGPDGKVYATARALFVAPKPQRLVVDVAKYLFQRAGEMLPGRGGDGRAPVRAATAAQP